MEGGKRGKRELKGYRTFAHAQIRPDDEDEFAFVAVVREGL